MINLHLFMSMENLHCLIAWKSKLEALVRLQCLKIKCSEDLEELLT